MNKKLINITYGLSQKGWMKRLGEVSNKEIYLVGGCVRDTFRGQEIKDIDIVVEGITLDQIKWELTPFGKVDVVGESFAVIKFRPTGHKGLDFDIAIPRKDIKTGEGHKGFEVETEGVGIFEDLRRRDFTINSIACNIFDQKIIDPFKGQWDIENKIIRATNPQAFIDDPLRILRGIQFAARFDYTIDIATKNMMRKNAHLIKSISGERILDELLKIINKHGNTETALNLIHETDVDEALFGQKMMKSENVPGFKHLDLPSFFYILSLYGGVNASEFIRKRLKGDCRLEKDVYNLDKLFSLFPETLEEEELKYNVSKIFTESPSLTKSVILPLSVENILKLMQEGQIPSSMKDVALNGNDIMEMSEGKIEGRMVGQILNRMFKDALMNRFNWKDRAESLKYLWRHIDDKR